MRSFVLSLLMSLALGSLLDPPDAEGTPLMLSRCTTYSLNADDARRVLDRMRYCALRRYTMSIALPELDKTNNPLIEYFERNPSGGSSSLDANVYVNYSTYNYGINTAYSSALYASSLFAGPYDQRDDGSGRYVWTRDESVLGNVRPRPLYPLYVVAGITKELVAFNLNRANDCGLYKFTAGDISTAPTGASTVTFTTYEMCEASCYPPEQEILFDDGFHSILDSLTALQPMMMTLSPRATLNSILLHKVSVGVYTREVFDGTHELLEFITQSGGRLRTTPNHPLVRSDGRLVEASTLRVGDALIGLESSIDPILSITKSSHFGKVYNIRPDTRDLLSNIVVAQGFLAGSSLYQNDYVGFINRLLLRSRIPTDVLPPR